MALFALLTAGGLLLLLRAGSANLADLLQAVRAARRGPLSLAAAAGLAGVLFGATRIWVLARAAHPDFRWRQGLRTHLYNAFFAGVTPAGTGGGPAQYLILRQSGLSGAWSVAVLSATWVGTLGALVVLGTVSLLYLLVRGELFAVGVVVRSLMLTVLLAAVGGFAFVLSPQGLERLLLGGGRAFQPRRARLSPARRRMIRALGRYRRAVLRFGGEARGAWGWNAACSACLFLARSSAGVFVLVALAIPPDPLSAIARQLLQFAAIYFSPVPGGSGIAEVTALGFMGGLVPVAAMGAYTLLWRAATAFLPIGVGGLFVAADQLRLRLRSSSP